MIVYRNSAGKILTHNGKILIKKTSTTTYPGIYNEQTITLPYGDELLLRVDSADEVLWSTDLDIAILWSNTPNQIIHWGSSIIMDSVTINTPLHLYEIDLYNEPDYLEIQGDGAAEADYIKTHGRYMGSIWIVEEDDAWVVDIVDQG